MAADPGVKADTIDADSRFTPTGVLGALLTLAERARDPGESLEATFARVVQQDPAGRELYGKWRRVSGTRYAGEA